MRVRLEGTGTRVGGRGCSSGQWIKGQVALSEKRGWMVVLKGQQAKKQGEGYRGIRALLTNEFLLIACFWDVSSLTYKLKLTGN